MMQPPLLVSSLLVHAERHHGGQEVVSRRVEGDVHRYTFRDMAARARRLANAVRALGLRLGDGVATLAWNGYRHLELHYAVPGIGAVLHPIDPRLHPDQLTRIADDAEDQVLFFDLSFLPLVEAIAPRARTLRAFVALTDRARMPARPVVPGLLCYEDLVEAASPRFEWPVFDEDTASALYHTSGTGGPPQGARFSHRSTVLRACAGALPDASPWSTCDAFLAARPMFRGDAWSLPYAACTSGAKLVFPGPFLDGASLYQLMEQEQVTMSAGVPGVWQGLLAHVEAHNLGFGSMRRTVIGESACPPELVRIFRQRYRVEVLPGWDMVPDAVVQAGSLPA